MHISNLLPALPTEDPRNPTNQPLQKHSNQHMQHQSTTYPTINIVPTTAQQPPPGTHRTQNPQPKQPPTNLKPPPPEPGTTPTTNHQEPSPGTTQTTASQKHPATNLTEPQSEYPPFTGLMCPHPATSEHPAFDLLSQYATNGCPADCGPPWTQAHLDAAIRRGAHPSARTPDAAAALRAEALKKVEQGFARLVTWDSIKDNPPTNLKISPLAAVPHKSRRYRAILDLSFQLRIGGLKLPSVNATTKPQAH